MTKRMRRVGCRRPRYGTHHAVSARLIAGVILAAAPFFVHRSWRHVPASLIGASGAQLADPDKRIATHWVRSLDTDFAERSGLTLMAVPVRMPLHLASEQERRRATFEKHVVVVALSG